MLRRLLAGSDLSSQHREVLNRAFVRTLGVLGLIDRDDPICGMVARAIIQVGISPEVGDPLAISESAIRQLKAMPPLALDARS